MPLMPKIDLIFFVCLSCHCVVFIPATKNVHDDRSHMFLLYLWYSLIYLYIAEIHLSYKSQLRNYAQDLQKDLHLYNTTQSGPHHEPIFKSTVTIDGPTFGSLQEYAIKKEAESAAAVTALVAIRQEAKRSEQMLMVCFIYFFILIGGILLAPPRLYISTNILWHLYVLVVNTFITHLGFQYLRTE